ncbi:MAG TPA: histidinol dehydrogenase, partial [Chitinophagaceae bacterium]|nr:histidinol dehydrogenase [Chitinophagaceae bacterium]
VAADLLSQAEHGPDSQVILITTHEPLIDAVKASIDKLLKIISREQMVDKALSNSRIFLVNNLVEAIALSNAYAPEHLILATKNAEELADQVVNAGSVFIGHFTPEAAGDYASGTNHTLPTNGYARAYSGVSVDSFVRKVTFQQISREGLKNVGPSVSVMAEAESLEAHRQAIEVRLKAIG